MPAYPYLFRIEDAEEAKREGDQPITLPPGYGPRVDQVVVPTPEALDLAKYMQGLDDTYPVLPAPAATAATVSTQETAWPPKPPHPRRRSCAKRNSPTAASRSP